MTSHYIDYNDEYARVARLLHRAAGQDTQTALKMFGDSRFTILSTETGRRFPDQPKNIDPPSAHDRALSFPVSLPRRMTEEERALRFPTTVPFALISKHAERVYLNHGLIAQDVAERGGLSPSELVGRVQGPSMLRDVDVGSDFRARPAPQSRLPAPSTLLRALLGAAFRRLVFSPHDSAHWCVRKVSCGEELVTTESRIDRANRLLSGEALDEDAEAPPSSAPAPKPAPARGPQRPAPTPPARPSTAVVLASKGAPQKPGKGRSKSPPAILEMPEGRGGASGGGRRSRRAPEPEEDEEPEEYDGDEVRLVEEDGEYDDSVEDDGEESDDDDDDEEDDDDDENDQDGPSTALARRGSDDDEEGGEEDDDEEPIGLQISTALTLPDTTVTESIGIVAQRGSGKALALDTPIPIPTGWTTMGALAVGDEIFDEQGSVCRVVKATEVMHNHLCYRVVFSDGEEIVADSEHLWLTDTIASRRAESSALMRQRRGAGVSDKPQCQRQVFAALSTTQAIQETLFVRSGDRNVRNHSVQNARSLVLPAASLPIDPYLLGSWLGNGTAQNATITTADPETLAMFRHAGYHVGEGFNPSDSGASATYRIGKGPDGVPLQTHLRRLGLLMNKRVPSVFMRGSIDQRKALLAGLIDTDGTIAVGSNMVTFGNMNVRLVEAAMELARSLGWTARLGTRRAILDGVDHGEFYNVSFTPTENVFRVARKARRFQEGLSQASRHRRRMIVAVEPTPSVPVRCIAVDSPSRLYLAGRGMVPTHNTYLTTVLAEEMCLTGLPFVILDPMGVYWGLRSSADGSAGGMQVIILGGDHGDLPLDPAGGRAIARWVLEHRAPAVLDLSNFRRADQRLFVGDFAEELFENCKDPLHVIVDEADLFIPQKPLPEDKRCLAAFEDIVRRGRSRGLGTTVVTQRPAVINKDILTQIGTLVVLRMTGPQDLDAIKDWVRSHGDLTRQRLMMASLPSLPIGTAWFWSPGWLGVLKRVQVRQKYTWDSSVTPKVGMPRPTPEIRADISIDLLREAISKSADHDPNSVTSLKTRIQELERALNEKEGSGATVTKLQNKISELEHRLMARPAAPKPSVDGGAIVTQMNALTKVIGELVKEVRGKK